MATPARALLGDLRSTITALTLALASACASAASAGTATGGIDPAAIYQRRCSVCHGEKGDGQSLATKALAAAPRDFTSEDARLRLTRGYMIAILRDGRPGTPMVGRKNRLNQEEIEAVVDFVRAAFFPPEPGSPLAQGRAIYLKACASCHGDRGRGGIGRSGKPSAPALAATRTPPGPTRDKIVDAIAREKHGSGTAGFGLSDADAQAVADYIATALIGTAAGPTASLPEHPPH